MQGTCLNIGHASPLMMLHLCHLRSLKKPLNVGIVSIVIDGFVSKERGAVGKRGSTRQAAMTGYEKKLSIFIYCSLLFGMINCDEIFENKNIANKEHVRVLVFNVSYK